MFRFETIVGIVIAFSCSTAALADTQPLNCDKQWETLQKYRQIKEDLEDHPSSDNGNKLETAKKRFDEIDKKYNECFNSLKPAKEDDCSDKKSQKELEEKVTKARREFRNACGSAGYSTSSADHNIECSESLTKCRVCGSKTGAEENTKLCSSSSSSDEDSSSSSGDDLKINFSKLSRQAEYCPHLGAKAQKDYEKRFDDSRKDVKDMEKKLPDAQKKYTEAINKGEDEAAQAEDKMVKAQQNLDQELSEAQERYTQAKKDIAAQIVQIQQQIAQVDDQTRQLVLAKSDAETQYNEAIRQIELNCYQSASATVAKLQAERLSRPFNRGGFQNMMKQVGLSDRASWQREAEKHYRYCLNSTPTKASKKSAKASYDSALKRADIGLQKVNEQRLGLVQQQMNLKNGACNPNAGSGVDLTGQAPEQSESCQAAQKAMADSQRAQRKYNSEANKAASDKMKAARKANNEAGSAQMEAANLKRQIQDEKQRMKNLRRAAEIADKASDDAPDPKAYERANEKFDEFKEVGFKFVQCMEKSECERNATCNKLADYFKANEIAVTGPKLDSGVKVADESRSTPAGKAGTPPANNPQGEGAK